MANTTIGSSSPKLYVEYSAEQIGASDTKRTIMITARFKVDGTSYETSYGYACDWRARIGSVVGAYQKMKGTETWRANQALREFRQTLEIDVGTTSSEEITVYIDTKSIIETGPSNDSNTEEDIETGWNGSCSWDVPVNAPRGRSGPSWPAGAKLTTRETGPTGALITTNKAIGEDVKYIYMTWPRATDAEDGPSDLRYAIWRSVDDGELLKVTTVTDGETHYYHYIGAGNQGRKYHYCIWAYDRMDNMSYPCWGEPFSKNVLVGYGLHSDTVVATSSTKIDFQCSNAYNTSGDTTFTTSITCPEVTIYNNTVLPTTITIYKSGPLPSGCYVKFDDLKNRFKNSGYKGTLNFSLTTRNKYGSFKTTTESVSVNLQSFPTTPVVTLSGSESTAYKQVTTGTGNNTSWKYVVDGHRTIRVKWTSSSDGLAMPIKYTISYRFGSSGDWIQLANNLTGLYYVHTVPLEIDERLIQYCVRAISTVTPSHYSDAYSPKTSIEYHNGITVTNGSIVRSATNIKVPVTVKVNTSLELPQIVATARLYKKGTNTQVGSTNTLSTVSGATSTVNISGLTESGVYDLKVVYRDRTGLTTDKTHLISISSLTPVLDIQVGGIGVKRYSSTEYPLAVNGPAEINGRIKVHGPAEVNDYIKIGNHPFVGWGVTRGGNYWAGLNSDDRIFQTYDQKYVNNYNEYNYANGVTDIGSGGCRWKRLYATTSTSITSDARMKENIKSYDDKVEDLYSKLKPCSFTRIDGDSGRRHYGFISQEVEEAVLDAGMEYHDFAPLYKTPIDKTGKEVKADTITDYDIDERIMDYDYSLCYEEFVSLNTHMIQKLQNENKEMRKEIDELKNLVASLINEGGDEVDKSQDKPTEGTVSE